MASWTRTPDPPTIMNHKNRERIQPRGSDVPAAGRTCFAGRDGFSILMGSAALSVQALKAGFNGLVPSSGNLVPELWQRLWNHASAGEWAEAEQLQARLDAIGAVLQRNRTLGGYLAALKAALAEQSVCTADVMPPLRPLPESDRASIRSELATLEVF